MNKLKTYLLLAGALLLFILAFVFLSVFLESNNDNEPCPLSYTVDLTGYEKLVNGSYLYEGLIIDPELWGVYEYKIDEFSNRISAKPHDRGCACLLRPCVKFCCPIAKYYQRGECMDFAANQKHTTKMNIVTKSGELNVDLTVNFTIQNGTSCFDKYYLTPDKEVDDAFSLFENGTLLVNNRHIFTKDQYCLSYVKINSTYRVPRPMVCSYGIIEASISEEKVDETNAIISAITMICSVPFFILTIIVYLAIPELRTLHGISLCCHLLGLSFSYSLLAKIILTPLEHHSNFICKTIGYSTYFSLMSSWSWISVICFDLYYNIHAPRVKDNQIKRFILYSIFAWGLASVLLSLTILADHSELIPEYWKPGISNDNRCWFNGVSGWTQLIYIYTPMVIIIVFCVIMFTLTSSKIYGIQKEINRMVENNDSQKNIRNHRERFGIFIRLFFIMGAPWTLEIVNNLLPKNSVSTLILDVILGLQGLAIFSLFVLKKKVRKCIIKRFLPARYSEPQSQESSKSQVSNTCVPLTEIGPYKR